MLAASREITPCKHCSVFSLPPQPPLMTTSCCDGTSSRGSEEQDDDNHPSWIPQGRKRKSGSRHKDASARLQPSCRSRLALSSCWWRQKAREGGGATLRPQACRFEDPSCLESYQCLVHLRRKIRPSPSSSPRPRPWPRSCTWWPYSSQSAHRSRVSPQVKRSQCRSYKTLP